MSEIMEQLQAEAAQREASQKMESSMTPYKNKKQQENIRDSIISYISKFFKPPE